MEEKFKKYCNESITVRFYPERCTGSAVCTSSLPEVFNTSCRPWVNVDGAKVEEIKRIIDCCPSGALQYEK